MRRALVLGSLLLVAACSSSESSSTGGASGGGASGAGAGGGPLGSPSSGGAAGAISSGGAAGSSSNGGMSASGAPDAAVPQTDWVTVSELGRGHGVVVEKVTYLSGDLRIFGQVCRPDDSAAHPLILQNHGGFEGLKDEIFTGDLAGTSFCLGAARLGYVVAESSYRGEDGSDGAIEVCLGEVDDVLAMLAVLRQRSYVDPKRVGAFGGSHGGCITTSVALRDPSLEAAVDYFGPSDLGELATWWQAQLDQNEPAPYCAAAAASACIAVHKALVDVVVKAIGALPSASNAAAYRARSPYYRLKDLTVPMVFLQGTADALVALEQGCNKREALTAAGHPPLSWYLDTTLKPKSPATVCGGGFRTDALPDTSSTAPWAADGPFFFVYEGQGHGFTGPASTQASTIALNFLIAHL